MDRLAAAVAIVAPFTAGGFTLAGVWLNQRFHERQRSHEREAAAAAKGDEATRELLDAVAALQIALHESVPLWNSRQSRLMFLGSAFVEFVAGKQAAGLEHGVAQASRLAVSYGDREVAAVLDRFRVPVERVSAATNRVALLPATELRTAALRVSDAVTAAAQAYAGDNVWRPKDAKAKRERADAELHEAKLQLLDAVDKASHSKPDTKPARRWRRAPRRLRAGRSRQFAAVTARASTPQETG